MHTVSLTTSFVWDQPNVKPFHPTQLMSDSGVKMCSFHFNAAPFGIRSPCPVPFPEKNTTAHADGLADPSCSPTYTCTASPHARKGKSQHRNAKKTPVCVCASCTLHQHFENEIHIRPVSTDSWGRAEDSSGRPMHAPDFAVTREGWFAMEANATPSTNYSSSRRNVPCVPWPARENMPPGPARGHRAASIKPKSNV